MYKQNLFKIWVVHMEFVWKQMTGYYSNSNSDNLSYQILHTLSFTIHSITKCHHPESKCKYVCL
jgi:hypothetical protein